MNDAERNEGTAGPQRRRRRRSRRRSGRPQDAAQQHGEGGGSGQKSGGDSRDSSRDAARTASRDGSRTASRDAARTASPEQGERAGDGQGQGTKSRRRRRGGRGRGSGGGGDRSGSTTARTSGSRGGHKADGTGSGSPKAGNQKTGGQKAGGSKSGGQKTTGHKAGVQKKGAATKGGAPGSGRSGERQGEKSGPGRSGSKRRQAGQPKGRPQRRPPGGRGEAQRAHMRTSIETSAGGLVVSGLAEAVAADGSVDLSRIYVALIGRLDRRGRLLWSMPKGHVEPGEAHDSTAEREVWEETGIHGEVIAELGVIDYWFVSDGTRIHKTVHHHLLRYVDGDLNDEDPEVTEVTWFPASSLVERLAYADERKLARRAHDLLPELAKAEKDAGKATPR